MSRKYIPVEINSHPYKIYLDNVVRIYKFTRQSHVPLPPYEIKDVSEKECFELETDESQCGQGIESEQ